MGRGCTMDEWVHFDKLPGEGRVPNSSYWYVVCRHCARGFEAKQLFNAPAKLTGRRSAMRAHLKVRPSLSPSLSTQQQLERAGLTAVLERSAQVCPMYATQYKLEQAAVAAAAAAAEAAAAEQDGAEDEDGAKKPEVGDKRKRRADRETSGPRTCLSTAASASA